MSHQVARVMLPLHVRSCVRLISFSIIIFFSKPALVHGYVQSLCTIEFPWKKRGSKTLYGITTLIAYYTGEIIDLVVKSN